MQVSQPTASGRGISCPCSTLLKHIPELNAKDCSMGDSFLEKQENKPSSHCHGGMRMFSKRCSLP